MDKTNCIFDLSDNKSFQGKYFRTRPNAHFGPYIPLVAWYHKNSLEHSVQNHFLGLLCILKFIAYESQTGVILRDVTTFYR